MSQDCDKAKHQLYQYLDDELDKETASSIRSHLEDCPGCSEPFDFERRLREAIKNCLSEDMPPSLEAKVRSLIREETA
ncbi:MAG: mycothiol system anti-sigma-R factor [Acidimicrobiia bacterium]|jgi:anti-sigma factor (TIGR02949 family)